MMEPRTDRALVLGGATSVWDEVLAWEERYGPWDGLVIAANDVGAHWPRALDHWATLHYEKMDRWRSLRTFNGFAPVRGWHWTVDKHGRVIAREHTKLVADVWSGGSSGMLAVQVAQLVGAQRVVLCGVPMSPVPHFTETSENHPGNWDASHGYWKAWLRYEHKVQGWVRSMSGRTRDLLGEPTPEWVHHIAQERTS